MIEWFKKIFNPPKLTVDERREAVLFKEMMMGGEVFDLGSKGTEKLIRRYGMPVRDFNGDRFDN